MTTDIEACGSFGIFTTVLVDAKDATFSSSSERYEVLAEQCKFRVKRVNNASLRGRLDKNGLVTRQGPGVVYGPLVMRWSAKTMLNWGPRIFGSTYSTNLLKAGTSFTPFDVLIKKDDGAVVKLSNCRVDRCLIESRAELDGEDPQSSRLTLWIMGKEEVDGSWPGTEPAVWTDTNPFWLHADMTVTMGQGDKYLPVEAMALSIQNNFQPLLRNALRAQCFRSAGRDINLSMVVPYNSDTHGYYKSYKNTVKINFLASKNVDGAMAAQTMFDFIRMEGERDTPNATSPNEIPLQLNLEAFEDPTQTSTKVVHVTNVLNS